MLIKKMIKILLADPKRRFIIFYIVALILIMAITYFGFWGLLLLDSEVTKFRNYMRYHHEIQRQSPSRGEVEGGRFGILHGKVLVFYMDNRTDILDYR